LLNRLHMTAMLWSRRSNQSNAQHQPSQRQVQVQRTRLTQQRRLVVTDVSASVAASAAADVSRQAAVLDYTAALRRDIHTLQAAASPVKVNRAPHCAHADDAHARVVLAAAVAVTADLASPSASAAASASTAAAVAGASDAVVATAEYRVAAAADRIGAKAKADAVAEAVSEAAAAREETAAAVAATARVATRLAHRDVELARARKTLQTAHALLLAARRRADAQTADYDVLTATASASAAAAVSAAVMQAATERGNGNDGGGGDVGDGGGKLAATVVATDSAALSAVDSPTAAAPTTIATDASSMSAGDEYTVGDATAETVRRLAARLALRDRQLAACETDLADAVDTAEARGRALRTRDGDVAALRREVSRLSTHVTTADSVIDALRRRVLNAEMSNLTLLAGDDADVAAVTIADGVDVGSVHVDDDTAARVLALGSGGVDDATYGIAAALRAEMQRDQQAQEVVQAAVFERLQRRRDEAAAAAAASKEAVSAAVAESTAAAAARCRREHEQRRAIRTLRSVGAYHPI
jgi:hypothetical protein